MKAITIHNPYAHMIVTPQDELPEGVVVKRIENRTWGTSYRGEIAIYAGLSMNWFRYGAWPLVDPEKKAARLDESQFPMMSFGAVVGVCNIVAVYEYLDILKDNVPEEHRWTKQHVHASGPKCIVLHDVQRLAEPVPATGRQGFWNLDPETAAKVRKQLS